MRFCVIAYRMNSKKIPSSIMRARTAPYIHAHRALSCRRRIERSDVLPVRRQQILPADAHHVERRTVLGKYRRFVLALHKARKRFALQKQTYRAFSKQTIDLQGVTADLIADDPYQDTSRAYMKSGSMARTREIVRTVKNSRFGTPERTANDREANRQSKKQRRSCAKHARAAIIYQQSTRPRAC